MRVLIVGDRAEDRDQCRRTARGLGLDCAAADTVPLADVRLRLARAPAVHCVLVLAEPDHLAAARAIRDTGHEYGPVVAVTAAADAGVEKLARDAGATDVWTITQVREGLLRAAEDARRAGSADYRRGRVIAVASAHPGAGVTTVASGLAFGLAGNGSVLLTEIGLGSPELALALDVTPPHSLVELLRRGDGMDASMIRNAAAHHPAGVDILAYLPDTLTTETLTAATARAFEILVRTGYDWVVLDTGHPQGDGTGTLLRQADVIVLVTRLDAPSLRRTRQYLRELQDSGVPAEAIEVVANRYGQNGLVPWRKAQEALKTTVNVWLPDDPKLVNQALTDGRPLIQTGPRSRLTRDLGALATTLRGRLAVAT